MGRKMSGISPLNSLFYPLSVLASHLLIRHFLIYVFRLSFCLHWTHFGLHTRPQLLLSSFFLPCVLYHLNKRLSKCGREKTDAGISGSGKKKKREKKGNPKNDWRQKWKKQLNSLPQNFFFFHLHSCLCSLPPSLSLPPRKPSRKCHAKRGKQGRHGRERGN